jgi:hypothetical protein
LETAYRTYPENKGNYELALLYIFQNKNVFSKVANTDAHYFWRLEPDPHLSEKLELSPDTIYINVKNSGDLEAQIGVAARGRSTWSPRGSVDHWSQLRITLIKEHCPDPAPHQIEKLVPDSH